MNRRSIQLLERPKDIALVTVEQAAGNVNTLVGINTDQVSIERGVMNLR
jgi:hypothetical protein